MDEKKDIVYAGPYPFNEMGAKYWKAGDQFRSGLRSSHWPPGGSSCFNKSRECGLMAEEEVFSLTQSRLRPGSVMSLAS